MKRPKPTALGRQGWRVLRPGRVRLLLTEAPFRCTRFSRRAMQLVSAVVFTFPLHSAPSSEPHPLTSDVSAFAGNGRVMVFLDTLPMSLYFPLEDAARNMRRACRPCPVGSIVARQRSVDARPLNPCLTFKRLVRDAALNDRFPQQPRNRRS